MNYRSILLNDFSLDELKMLVGINDENLKQLEILYDTDIFMRDDELKIKTEDDDIYHRLNEQVKCLSKMIKDGQVISNDDIIHTFNVVTEHHSNEFSSFNKRIIAYNYNNQAVRVKTFGQAKLIEAIENNEIVFASGPAGTGKTFLAVLMAVNALKANKVKKIVLTRPAVEAGESLGFLPGDLKEKVDPYLMPLYDSLNDLLGAEKVQTLIERQAIEIIPLAYMRGRTLNDSFVILDEAQNTTSTQMLMFLTRLGAHSKMVITGDATQIDLNIKKTSSGLLEAIARLKGIKGIEAVHLKRNDVVRNPLVQAIIDRYEAND